MLEPDALTLDQLRLFVAVAEEGGFSAAARRLRRAQSAVSAGVANLERLLGVRLFDRSGRRTVPTEAGRELLLDARQVLDAAGRFRARAAEIAGGVEPEVRIAVDAICPAGLLVEVARAFHERFPSVSLRIETDVLEGVVALVVGGRCQVGVAGLVDGEGERLERRFLGAIPLVPVAAATHPLSRLPPPLSREQVRGYVQVVIGQRAGAPSGEDRHVLSDATWRVADAPTKLALVRAGLGWGSLPLDLVERDLAEGRLVRLHLREWGPDPLLAPLSAIARADVPPGPAGRWLMDALVELWRRCAPAPAVAPTRGGEP